MANPKRTTHRVALSMIVTACLLTLTIAVSACDTKGTDGDGSRPAFFLETDFSWKSVFTASGPVTSIAAGGPGAVWASDKRGNIYFFNGSTWRTQFRARDYKHNNIVCMCAFGPKRAYAVNTNSDSLEGGQPKSVLYSFNGSAWARRAELEAEIRGVAALGGTLTCVVGGERRAGSTSGVIYFYDGSTFRKQLEMDEVLTGVSAAGENRAWAVGDKGGVYFFDGRRWSKQRDVGGTLNCVASIDASQVYVGGSATVAGRDTGVVHAFDGSKWTKIGEFPATTDQQGSPNGISVIAGVDYYHIWAVGNAAYSYNGSFWRIFYHPPGDFPPTCLTGSDTEHVWAGTADGGIYLRINVVPLRHLFPKETFR